LQRTLSQLILGYGEVPYFSTIAVEVVNAIVCRAQQTTSGRSSRKPPGCINAFKDPQISEDQLTRLTAASTPPCPIFSTMTNHDTVSNSKLSAEIVKIEHAAPEDATVWLQQYPLLAEKSPEELTALNKAVLKKLDWKFLPCITLMLLMKYVTMC
jgi:hypothetical protein